MNIIDKIKALFALNTFVNTEIKEATQMAGTTPGWRTTEFYLNLATQIGVLWAGVRGFVPPKTAAIIEVAGVAVYTIARTVLKAVQDVKSAQAPTDAPVEVKPAA